MRVLSWSDQYKYQNSRVFGFYCFFWGGASKLPRLYFNHIVICFYCLFQHWCTEDRVNDKVIQTAYTLILVLLTYVVPLVIMFVAYVLIAKTLNSRGAGLECTTTAQDKSKRKVRMCMLIMTPGKWTVQAGERGLTSDILTVG